MSNARKQSVDGGWRGYLGWVAAGGVVSAGIRGAHDNHHLGSLLVDPYWVGFYVTNFQDGFRRRALIGTICRLLQPHGMNVIVINILAVCALTGVLWLFVRAVLRLASPAMPRTVLFCFALFASALCSAFFEVLGDTLQIAFLVFALFAVLPVQRVNRQGVRLGLALAGLVMAFFVHEASAFLLAPCIPFLVQSRVKLRDFAVPAVALVLLVGLSVHWSHLETHLTYHAISIPRGMVLEDLAATPSFFELLRLEIKDDFSTQAKFAFFLIKCASVSGLGLAGLLALSNSFGRQAMERTMAAFAAILIFSAPLWVIAHDWGRFLAYTFLLATLAASTEPRLEIGFAKRWLSRLTAWTGRVARVEPLQCAALLLLLASPYYQSRIFGMHIRDLLSSLLIVAVGLVAYRSRAAWGSEAE